MSKHSLAKYCLTSGLALLAPALADAAEPLTDVTVTGATITDPAVTDGQITGGSISAGTIHSARQRDRGVVDIYFGGVYDNFSGPVRKYINYEDEDPTWRSTGGINYELGVISSADGDHSLWANGKISWGVRTGEVDCSATDAQDRPAVCNDLSGFPTDAQQRGRYLLRNSTSIEGGIGLRYEYRLDHWSTTLTSAMPRSSFFLNYEYGGVAVDDDDDDIADVTSLGAGIIVTEGRFRGSFVEVGRGKNEIFTDDPSDRTKIKARAMVSEIKVLSDDKPFGVFIQLNVDADGGSGADSIQTYVGFNARLSSIF